MVHQWKVRDDSKLVHFLQVSGSNPRLNDRHPERYLVDPIEGLTRPGWEFTKVRRKFWELRENDQNHSTLNFPIWLRASI